MVGTIELDPDGRNVLIRFPYREDLIEEVRSLPGRRWDRSQKLWRVPASHAELVVTTFMRHGFVVTADVTSIIAGTQGVSDSASLEDEPDAAAAESAAPWSVSELNDRVRGVIQREFPSRVQVVGEVSDFDKSKDRKHVFFTLVEKGVDRPKARVDVALFERTAKRLLPTLETQGLTMRDGIEILVEARVDLYPQTGRFQLILEEIRPEFTIGKLELSREEILGQLKKDGLERTQLERAWPSPAMRVGVLTSPDSDGWNDFIKELEGSAIGFQLALVPIKVQGDELKPTMLRGLSWFAERSDDFDVLCVVRGGGSRTDLAWFDDLEIARAVATHPLKVVCGIGHQRDRSILDTIAASEKTPTAAAARLVAAWQETQGALVSASHRLRDTSQEMIAAATSHLTQRARLTARVLAGRLSGEQHRLLTDGHRLARLAQGIVRREIDRLRPERLAHRCALRQERERHRVDTATARHRLLDPTRVLQRGYAMVRDSGSGQIVTDASALHAGQSADILFRDGHARTRIESTHTEPNETPTRNKRAESDGSP